MNIALSGRPQDKKKTLIQLQWLLVLATSYLVLFKNGQVVDDPWAFSLVVVLLTSSLVVHRLPQAAFEHKLFDPTLVVVDTILILLAIGLNRESPWDLFVVFFFGLFITATGESLLKIVAGCLIISIISVIISPYLGIGHSYLDSDLLFRIPFFFGIFVLYGYMGDQTRKEKSRAEKAEAMESLKRQLVSALAHDIKNPLGVIMGYAETVTARLEGKPEGNENSEALQRIQDNAQRIVKLVTGFLDASKAEAGKVELVPQPLQLNTLFREVGQQHIGELRRKNILLSADLDEHLPMIVGDEGHIERVLWNLVGNAIKFTPSGGTITLASRLDNGQVCASVKDTGMGISQDEVPILFSEFRRLEGTAKIEGTGLGLFVVKTIVEAHKGTVGVESREGEGSTFTVRFPVKP